MKSASHERGFLLTEALIALLILSIALTAAMGGIGRALKIAGRGEAVTKAVYDMEQRLFEIEMNEGVDMEAAVKEIINFEL